MNFPRSLQTAILAMLVIGILLLALGGYLTPLSRVALSPFVGAQTWLAERYSALRDYLTAPPAVTRLTQRIAELEVLSALLDFARTNPGPEYLTAAVIGRDTSPFLHYIIIKRGSDDGLRRGMPVVSSQGLVGRVAAVTAGAARVQLITDPNSVVNVHIQPSGAEAMLTGSITGDLTIESIPQADNVQIGDLVLTSGLGGNYPANILIGQISGVSKLPVELFQTASVQPIVDFSQLEVVLVITNFQPAETAPLIPTPAP